MTENRVEGANQNADGRGTARAEEQAPDLLKALRAASGYLQNARIDLETGAPKRTAIRTIEGGLKIVNEAIAKAEGRS